MKFISLFLMIFCIGSVSSGFAVHKKEDFDGLFDKFNAAGVAPVMVGRNYFSIMCIEDLVQNAKSGNQSAVLLTKEISSAVELGEGKIFFHPSQLKAVTALLSPYMPFENLAM
jgi:hypothetical protein